MDHRTVLCGDSCKSSPKQTATEPTAEADRGRHTGFPRHRGFAGGPGSLALAFNGNNSVFSNASSHSRITNAFSDIGRPRSCALARFGTIRSATPVRVWLATIHASVPSTAASKLVRRGVSRLVKAGDDWILGSLATVSWPSAPPRPGGCRRPYRWPAALATPRPWPGPSRHRRGR